MSISPETGRGTLSQPGCMGGIDGAMRASAEAIP
jgi:hypothetical protein